MTTTTPKSHREISTNSTYWLGLRDGLPFLFVISPFGLLFGVVAAETGLNILETMMFSIVVIAGAAQFTALQLMQENAPTIVVIVSALAVNLRMAMYSASLTPHIGAVPVWRRATMAYMLTDQSYACSIAAYERHDNWSVAQKSAFFLGTCTPVIPAWIAMSCLGAYLGAAIPPWMALDFAVPICFLALIAPMLRTLAHIAAAATAVILALLFAFVPYNLGLLIAGIGGMMAGAQAELFISRTQNEVPQ